MTSNLIASFVYSNSFTVADPGFDLVGVGAWTLSTGWGWDWVGKH